MHTLGSCTGGAPVGGALHTRRKWRDVVPEALVGLGILRAFLFPVRDCYITANQVRDLRGVIEREKAEIGVSLSLEKPTPAMKAEAAGAGFYTSSWTGKDYPRLQCLTIADLLAGKRIDYPSYSTNVTFKKAPRAKVAGAKQELLPID